MLIKLADSSLSQYEREEKEIERLIDKSPAPSRKDREKHGPHHDQRRERIKTDDPDMKSADKDLSLNYKQVGSVIDRVALRISADPVVESKKPSKKIRKKVPEQPEKKFEEKSGEPETKLVAKKPKIDLGIKPSGESDSRTIDLLIELYEQIFESLDNLAPSVAKSFHDYAYKAWLDPKKKDLANSNVKTANQILGKLKNAPLLEGNIDDPISFAERWPSNTQAWAERAFIISELSNSIDGYNIPAPIKKALLGVGRKISNEKAVSAILKNVLKFPSMDEEEVRDFAALTIVYDALRTNPDKISVGEVKNLIKNSSEVVSDQVRQIESLKEFTEQLNKYEKVPVVSDDEEEIKDTPYFRKLEKTLSDIDDFFYHGSGNSITDSKLTRSCIEEMISDHFGGEIPHELKEKLKNFHSVAASYRPFGGNRMTAKVATYHGILNQGNPDGTSNTPYKSYDKRYFGKDHFDSIIKMAKGYLEEDWVKYGWDDGAEDAKYRAALDLSIHMADSNLYQSKIDTDTYGMLLNRLRGGEDDTFEADIPSFGVNRSASAMNASYQNILRIANDLRKTNPQAALSVLEAFKTVLAQQEQEGMHPNTSQEQEACNAAKPMPVAQVTQLDTDDFVHGKLNLDDLKRKSKKLIDITKKSTVSEKDMDDFIAGLKDLNEVMKKKVASRKASGSVEFTSLSDMSDDEIKAFFKTVSPKLTEADKFLNDADLAQFDKSFDDIIMTADNAAKHLKTSSVRVSLATLVRLAHEVPAAAKVLMPVLAAAKKKMDKKKSKKVSQEKEELEEKAEKKPVAKGDKKAPFGGKKAPPFGKKDTKTSKKVKKHKASVELSDTEW